MRKSFCNSSGRQKIPIEKSFKNVQLGPGFLLKNLAVYMFEAFEAPTLRVRASKAADRGAAAEA
jgi:hypothetical protein